VNYAKLLEMNSFFTLHNFLEVGKTQDLPSKFWQTIRDALGKVIQVSIAPLPGSNAESVKSEKSAAATRESRTSPRLQLLASFLPIRK
jgi:hypothetical protein